MNPTTIVISFFILGVVLRATIPYLTRWLDSDEPVPFDYRYVIGQLTGALAAIIPMLLNSEWVDTLLAARPEAAVAIGWFAADAGREAFKLVGAAASWYGNGQ